MSCFQKTNDVNKEMTIFTIAKQSKKLTLACKKKKTIENEYKSPH